MGCLLEKVFLLHFCFLLVLFSGIWMMLSVLQLCVHGGVLCLILLVRRVQRSVVTGSHVYRKETS